MIYERINWKNGEEGNTPINDVNLNKMDEAIAYLFENGVGGGGDNTPIGTIFAYGGENAPEGYLLADGQEVSRTEYVDLFNVYGTTYGEGNGSTTFNVPDYRDRVPVGLNVNTEYFNSLGKKGGEANHTLTIAETPSHRHNFEIPKMLYADESSGSVLGGEAIVEQATHYTNYQGGNQPHNNLQPYIVTNYIIKATKVTPTQAEVEDSLESNSTTNAPSIHAVNEALNGTVLYENADGSNETITLNDSASNYKYVEIYFKTSEHGILGYKKVYNPNNQVTDLTTTLYSSGFIRIDTARVILNDNQLNFKENNCAYAIIANESTTITTNPTIVVTRVVGYK